MNRAPDVVVTLTDYELMEMPLEQLWFLKWNLLRFSKFPELAACEVLEAYRDPARACTIIKGWKERRNNEQGPDI